MIIANVDVTDEMMLQHIEKTLYHTSPAREIALVGGLDNIDTLAVIRQDRQRRHV